MVNMSMDMPSIGVISHIMPLSVILQVMVAIMTGIGIMPPIIDIMLFIIGIMPFIMGIGMGIMPIIGIWGIGFFISLVACIVLSVGFRHNRGDPRRCAQEPLLFLAGSCPGATRNRKADQRVRCRFLHPNRMAGDHIGRVGHFNRRFSNNLEGKNAAFRDGAMRRRNPTDANRLIPETDGDDSALAACA